jgi:flavin reductase (DIM6/NTAB) family NADH-FMN oxidoreductase RutF
MDGRLTAAHMTPVPSEAASVLRALECPMQLEARIEGKIDSVVREHTTFETNALRVHLNPSVGLSDVQPNQSA